MNEAPVKTVLLTTGLSGAGKTTVLKTLEDIGWDTVDNFPFNLLERLLNTPPSSGRTDDHAPLALGFGSQTRGFEPDRLIKKLKQFQQNKGYQIGLLFLDCSGEELERRYSETRRRHPLALDRPASDGIALERALMEPLRRWADHVIVTTSLSANDLQKEIRQQFASSDSDITTISITSFGFSRGIPNNIDLLFDVRFLNNPFWDPDLKQLNGLDPPVGEYIRKDPAYAEAMTKFEDMLKFLLPKYSAAGKAYVNIGIGCTGGRHRSVFVAEQLSKNLHEDGFSLNVSHRNLASRPIEALESMRKLKAKEGI